MSAAIITGMEPLAAFYGATDMEQLDSKILEEEYRKIASIVDGGCCTQNTEDQLKNVLKSILGYQHLYGHMPSWYVAFTR